MSKLRHKGNSATFSEDNTKKIRKVGRALDTILFETAADNWDTQMLEQAVYIMRKVYYFQFRED